MTTKLAYIYDDAHPDSNYNLYKQTTDVSFCSRYLPSIVCAQLVFSK